ncbi:phage-related capsid scaffolding protein [Novosphingobium nitrogenifigens DSM 19370]|uniref:Phage-related capsid scaffolding protein n=1 Tax=Novosphingobium nitrogenifigens DSM 19370 TaxID=983920 RepID=F1Z9A2_9SPHN|nr:GPO family capsid scaffolding protein [Novosphingobium nitrogenifigens]EGD58403.1 phage-related capsid scaffolding protein [Novosphingobium nitrogenifigens DSM 19370]
MGQKTRFFRVATSGATTDGRNIEERWLREMADTYDPVTYQARVNLEHIRGVSPEGPFGTYGDVLSLRTEPVQLNVGGKLENRLGLYAEVDAHDPLVDLSSKKQKLFTSIEVNPNFAGSNKAYLVGLAVTDNPASLGTEMLSFCARQGEHSPLAARKQDPGNLFSALEEAAIEFADAPAAHAAGEDGSGDSGGEDSAAKKMLGVLARALGLSASSEATPVVAAAPVIPAAPAVVTPPAEPAHQHNSASKPSTFTAALADPQVRELAQAGLALFSRAVDTLDKLGERSAKTETDLAELTQRLASTPATQFRERPVHTGGPDIERTDC